MYKVEYLPIARQDMLDAVRYISTDLKNPAAATHLAEALLKAGNSLSELPYRNPVYMPIKSLGHEYRRCIVQNFLMFYWVDEQKKCITVARVIYSARNYLDLLE